MYFILIYRLLSSDEGGFVTSAQKLLEWAALEALDVRLLRRPLECWWRSLSTCNTTAGVALFPYSRAHPTSSNTWLSLLVFFCWRYNAGDIIAGDIFAGDILLAIFLPYTVFARQTVAQKPIGQWEQQQLDICCLCCIIVSLSERCSPRDEHYTVDKSPNDSVVSEAQSYYRTPTEHLQGFVWATLRVWLGVSRNWATYS